MLIFRNKDIQYYKILVSINLIILRVKAVISHNIIRRPKREIIQVTNQQKTKIAHGLASVNVLQLVAKFNSTSLMITVRFVLKLLCSLIKCLLNI